MAVILRPYQEEAVASIFNYFVTEVGNPIVAMPTGTGKSLVQAEFIRRACGWYPTTRILAVTHVQELIEQNVAKLREVWPQAPVGIYSAGLGRRDLGFPITFAGIQSLDSVLDALGKIDLVIIDECHLVSHKNDTRYMALIDFLMRKNPHLKVIGLTATPYRLGLGMLTDGGVFDHICYDLTSIDKFNQLIADGYLCKLVPRSTSTEVTADGVKIQGGEFVQKELQEAVDKAALTEAAVREIIHHGQNRKRWLIFAAGVQHANHVAEMLGHFGIKADTIDGKLDSPTRRARLEAFRRGDIQAMVNNSVLTTGFDLPELDLIGMLRPTMSPSLWVQMLGRGTRPFQGKTDCLVLDFARNTVRLGPINDPMIPSARGRGKEIGKAPVRLCPNCGTYCHASVRVCPECGHKFPENLDKFTAHASSEALIAESTPTVNLHKVTGIEYTLHRKIGKPDSMQVLYQCGLRRFKEYVHFEHGGYSEKRAHDWWSQRSSAPPPPTVALALIGAQLLPVPKEIRVWEKKPYPEVLSHVF